MDDRRLLIFFAFSLAILVGWQMLVPPPAPISPDPVATEETEESLPADLEQPEPSEAPEAFASSIQPEGSSPVLSQEPLEAERQSAVVVETDKYRAEIDNKGAQLTSFVLKEHLDSAGVPLDLVRRRDAGPWPLGLVNEALEPHPLGGALFAVERSTESGNTRLDFEYRGALGEGRKSMTFGPSGLIDLDVEVAEAGWGVVLGPGIRNQDPEGKESRFNSRKSVLRLDGDIETDRVDKLDELEAWPGRGISWVGMEDTHFLSVFLPKSAVSEVVLQPVTMEATARPEAAAESDGEDVGDSAGAMLITPFENEEGLTKEARELPRDARWIVRSSGTQVALSAYFGPKEFAVLADLGEDLEKTVEWGGVLRLVVRPLLAGLKWIHDNGVPNYGWAIILMTIGLKIVLFPLTHKSYISMQKMQKLQPQMKAIRQKYRGRMRDKRGKMDLDVQRKMNEEMQALFRSEGASPTGGCLPILLQMPVFFAFFRLLSTAVELRHEPWILWIKDLSVPDPFYLLPILMGSSQIVQQKLTPMSADPMQRKIVQLFPWMFMIFSLSFPSGLVLYWTVNNVFTIAQTAAYKKWRERKDAEEKLLAKARKAEERKRR